MMVEEDQDDDDSPEDLLVALQHRLRREVRPGRLRRDADQALDTATRPPTLCAVKVIDISQMSLAKIKREVAIARKLKHANVVATRRRPRRKQEYVIFMELCDGKELFDQVEAIGTISEEQARGWFVQLMAGVAYLHGIGIVHRDLKLENVMLTSAGGLKIIDFGLAHEHARDPKSSPCARRRSTTCAARRATARPRCSRRRGTASASTCGRAASRSSRCSSPSSRSRRRAARTGASPSCCARRRRARPPSTASSAGTRSRTRSRATAPTCAQDAHRRPAPPRHRAEIVRHPWMDRARRQALGPAGQRRGRRRRRRHRLPRRDVARGRRRRRRRARRRRAAAASHEEAGALRRRGGRSTSAPQGTVCRVCARIA